MVLELMKIEVIDNNEIDINSEILDIACDAGEDYYYLSSIVDLKLEFEPVCGFTPKSVGIVFTIEFDNCIDINNLSTWDGKEYRIHAGGYARNLVWAVKQDNTSVSIEESQEKYAFSASEESSMTSKIVRTAFETLDESDELLIRALFEK